MTTSPSSAGRVLPFPELAALRWPVPLATPYWTRVDSAIAWIGFGNALPVSWWDTELAFGLSLWPWDTAFRVELELKRWIEEPGCKWFLDEGPRGRSTGDLRNALLQFHGRRRENPWTAERRPDENSASTRARSDASIGGTLRRGPASPDIAPWWCPPRAGGRRRRVRPCGRVCGTRRRGALCGDARRSRALPRGVGRHRAGCDGGLPPGVPRRRRAARRPSKRRDHGIRGAFGAWG